METNAVQRGNSTPTPLISGPPLTVRWTLISESTTVMNSSLPSGKSAGAAAWRSHRKESPWLWPWPPVTSTRAPATAAPPASSGRLLLVSISDFLCECLVELRNLPSLIVHCALDLHSFFLKPLLLLLVILKSCFGALELLLNLLLRPLNCLLPLLVFLLHEFLLLAFLAAVG